MPSPRIGEVPLDAIQAPRSATILVGDAFPEDLHKRIDKATQRVLVQFMTYEGDDAGWALTERLLAARERGVDVKVAIDAYTDRYVSDKPHTHPDVQEEVQETKRMMETLREAGIPLTRTRPYGPLDVFFLVRDHKKIVVTDDACYLGGINVSDHNYAWHDFMTRFDDARLADQCASIFEATTRGEEPNLALETGLVTNRHVEEAFDALVEQASEHLILSSPYLADTSILRALLTKAREGVDVTVLTLATNNIEIFNHVAPYIHTRLREHGIDVYTYDAFSHAKFLLVDDEYTLTGSSNFGLDSFLCKDEIAIIQKDPSLARRLRERLIHDQEANLRTDTIDPTRLEYALSFLSAHLVEAFLRTYGTLVPPLSHVLDE